MEADGSSNLGVARWKRSRTRRGTRTTPASAPISPSRSPPPSNWTLPSPLDLPILGSRLPLSLSSLFSHNTRQKNCFQRSPQRLGGQAFLSSPQRRLATGDCVGLFARLPLSRRHSPSIIPSVLQRWQQRRPAAAVCFVVGQSRRSEIMEETGILDAAAAEEEERRILLCRDVTDGGRTGCARSGESGNFWFLCLRLRIRRLLFLTKIARPLFNPLLNCCYRHSLSDLCPCKKRGNKPSSSFLSHPLPSPHPSPVSSFYCEAQPLPQALGEEPEEQHPSLPPSVGCYYFFHQPAKPLQE